MKDDGNGSEPETGGRAARTGAWLVGARGSAATTAVAGCAAVAARLRPPTGMVTETTPFNRSAARDRPAVRTELRAADQEMRLGGPLPGDTRSDEKLITDFAADLVLFRVRNAPARVAVVNPLRAALAARSGARLTPPARRYIRDLGDVPQTRPATSPRATTGVRSPCSPPPAQYPAVERPPK